MVLNHAADILQNVVQSFFRNKIQRLIVTDALRNAQKSLTQNLEE